MKTTSKLQFISSLDILGARPSLNIGQKSQYKTICGGTLTLLLALVAILVVINSSIDLVSN